MNSKILLAALIGFLAINVSTQSPTYEAGGLKDQIAEVANAILGITAELLKLADNAVANLNKNIDTLKEDIIKEVSKALQNVNNGVVSYLDSLESDTNADGKIILKCIHAEQPKAEKVIGQISSDIGNCAYNEAEKVIEIVNFVLKQLKDLQAKVEQQTKSLKSCFLGDVLCLTGFANNLLNDVKNFPIQAIIKTISDSIQVITQDLRKCGSNVVAEIKSDAQEVFNEAVVCFKK